jgi:hypothetical protein
VTVLRVLALPILLASATTPAQHAHLRTVPQCSGVTLSAAYLAEVNPGEGPGFLVVIANNTDQPVKLVQPIPSSAHWYAQTGTGPWHWRASTGSGGALADAFAEHGPLLAYPAPAGASSKPEYVTVAPHGQVELAESMKNHPILNFHPGCQHCSNPADESFRAVLAYAYLPSAADEGLLPCGLRSGLVVMPPLR